MLECVRPKNLLNHILYKNPKLLSNSNTMSNIQLWLVRWPSANWAITPTTTTTPLHYTAVHWCWQFWNTFYRQLPTMCQCNSNLLYIVCNIFSIILNFFWKSGILAIIWYSMYWTSSLCIWIIWSKCYSCCVHLYIKKGIQSWNLLCLHWKLCKGKEYVKVDKSEQLLILVSSWCLSSSSLAVVRGFHQQDIIVA